ncbi:unnamed protein product [Nesidiocoris tenuis]|uniref:Uncharacterized protein n=1 Tax=Nesidiocoris tenuis TaxID=355587 RepID=A0A6H5HA60_9HEMI|nr:unnamed protein product [Nesidiocoris tenuis]
MFSRALHSITLRWVDAWDCGLDRGGDDHVREGQARKDNKVDWDRRPSAFPLDARRKTRSDDRKRRDDNMHRYLVKHEIKCYTGSWRNSRVPRITEECQGSSRFPGFPWICRNPQEYAGVAMNIQSFMRTPGSRGCYGQLDYQSRFFMGVKEYSEIQGFMGIQEFHGHPGVPCASRGSMGIQEFQWHPGVSMASRSFMGI